MSNSALQIELNTSTTVGVNARVLFDTIVYLSGNISYNPAKDAGLKCIPVCCLPGYEAKKAFRLNM